MNALVLAQLRQLKLGGMAPGLTAQLDQTGTYEGLSFLDCMSLLLDQEHCSREQRKHERLIRQGRFKLKAGVQEIDYQHLPNITPSRIVQIAQSDWIRRVQNLLITGPCGSGKTFIASALGHSACLLAYSVPIYRLSRLLLELTRAKADGSYPKL